MDAKTVLFYQVLFQHVGNCVRNTWLFTNEGHAEHVGSVLKRYCPHFTTWRPFVSVKIIPTFICEENDVMIIDGYYTEYSKVKEKINLLNETLDRIQHECKDNADDVILEEVLGELPVSKLPKCWIFKKVSDIKKPFHHKYSIYWHY